MRLMFSRERARDIAVTAARNARFPGVYVVRGVEAFDRAAAFAWLVALAKSEGVSMDDARFMRARQWLEMFTGVEA